MDLRVDLLKNPDIEVSEDLFYQKGFHFMGEFEKKYIELRDKEHRLYPDEVVAQLPVIDRDNPQREEWAIRANSLQKIIRHLSRLPSRENLLDVGCGNGWLANRLSQIGINVVALDANLTELRQAARTFKRTNLSFVYGDVFHRFLDGLAFDIILLASCIQYFPDLTMLINRLMKLMAPSGRILIVDSPIYRSTASASRAETRSRKYLSSVGMPEMANSYFHHTIDALAPFSFKVIHDPSGLRSRVKRVMFGEPSSPFPLIQIFRS